MVFFKETIELKTQRIIEKEILKAKKQKTNLTLFFLSQENTQCPHHKFKDQVGRYFKAKKSPPQFSLKFLKSHEVLILIKDSSEMQVLKIRKRLVKVFSQRCCTRQKAISLRIGTTKLHEPEKHENETLFQSSV
ncbi:MAG: hypothetical protein HYS98_06625 [Deltaproteobacteria bacterium]|nr:hypothetical protein [Deltaproteobacteria bacterium]